jgi:histidyl-tRNA synthetase
MSKKNKPARVKARLPRGFIDRSAADLRATDGMIAKIREVFERYGFDPIETPMFEYTDALGKFLPDAERPNAGVLSLTDDDDQWMSLRYDLTAPLARHVAENINNIQMPYRTYRSGYVFRNEKPGPGRFRQFMQMDADSVGAPGVQADAEMCMMLADTMEALGIKRGDYVVRVNNRKVLDGVMEAIGLGGDGSAGRRLMVLRAIDKLDRLGVEGVLLLLGNGRKDESGDFTKGAGLDDVQVDSIFQVFFRDDWDNPHSTTGNAEADTIDDDVKSEFGKGSRFDNLYFLKMLEGKMDNSGIFDGGLQELLSIERIVRDCGYGTKRIQVDPSIVRGLEYYTGPVYECELTFPVTNEKGEEVVFGSVAGGGRYDGLVERFTGQKVPATGFSIGVSRLMTALKNLGKLDSSAVLAPVLVTVMDGDTGALGRYQKMVQDLRNAGIRAEMYQGNWKKFGNQLKYADRRGCPIAIIQGSDEFAAGEVQIKDLIEGARLSADIKDNETWRESRPAQISVPVDQMVEAVRAMLDKETADT